MTTPRLPARGALAALLASITLVGCTRADAAKPAPQAAARRVAVCRPRVADLARRIDLPANVLALEQATQFAQVPGYLAEIRVDKGDAVREGDVLAVIAIPELDAQARLQEAGLAQTVAEAKGAATALERARAEEEQSAAEEAKADAAHALETSLLERTKGLRTDEAVSVQDLEVATAREKEADQAARIARARRSAVAAATREAEARVGVAAAKVDVAKAALAQTQARRDLATIRAPFDGRVTARFVDRGALISASVASSQGAPVVTVARMDRVRVQVHVPEEDVGAAREGQEIELTVDAWPGRIFAGKVARFAHALDPSTRTMLVEAELANADGALLPGMFARARLVLERRSNALSIPAEALVLVEKKPFVWRIEGGAAHRVAIETGIDDGATIEVTSGLRPEDALIVGARGLTDGVAVVPVTATAKTEG